MNSMYVALIPALIGMWGLSVFHLTSTHYRAMESGEYEDVNYIDTLSVSALIAVSFGGSGSLAMIGVESPLLALFGTVMGGWVMMGLHLFAIPKIASVFYTPKDTENPVSFEQMSDEDATPSEEQPLLETEASDLKHVDTNKVGNNFPADD